MTPLRNDVRSPAALPVNLRFERGPINDRFRFGFDRSDHARVVALAALFRAHLNEADGLSLAFEDRRRLKNRSSEYVRQTERISFSFAERITSTSLMNSSVIFWPFSSRRF